MTGSPSTRYSLLLRIQDPQNHAAWVEFVAVYEPLVYGLARRKGLQDADAHDLCQEVLGDVAGAARRWNPDPARGSFRGWLFRIARNRLANYFKQRDRQVRGTGDTDVQRVLENQPAEADPFGRTIQVEYRRRLFQVAAESIEAEFTASTWRAFWRTAVESRAVADVAGELGMSAGAVYIARSRVLARLRRRVQEISGGE